MFPIRDVEFKVLPKPNCFPLCYVAIINCKIGDSEWGLSCVGGSKSRAIDGVCKNLANAIKKYEKEVSKNADSDI
jgi:hypothetical protein